MKRLVAIVPAALLMAACGTSGSGGKAATVTNTVTKTITATVAAAPGSSAAATDSPTSAAAGAAPDACSLLTQSEAQKVAGTKLDKPVGAGEDASGADVQCQWTGPTSGPTAQVEVYVGDGAKQQLHIDRDNLKHAFTSVPGVGDQCLQEEGFIFVQKNGLWASIRLVRLDDPKLHVKPLQNGIRELAARLP